MDVNTAKRWISWLPTKRRALQSTYLRKFGITIWIQSTEQNVVLKTLEMILLCWDITKFASDGFYTKTERTPNAIVSGPTEQRRGWKCLYSPLKAGVSGNFRNNDAIVAVVKQEIVDFNDAIVQVLVHRWWKCITSGCDYVDKMLSSWKLAGSNCFIVFSVFVVVWRMTSTNIFLKMISSLLACKIFLIASGNT